MAQILVLIHRSYVRTQSFKRLTVSNINKQDIVRGQKDEKSHYLQECYSALFVIETNDINFQ